MRRREREKEREGERERERRIESNKQSAVGHCNVQFVE